MTYYEDLLNDTKRVNTFKKAILDKCYGITYDLGTGSGILAQFASKKAKKVYAVEQNPFILKHTENNLSKYDNVKLINTDASTFKFPEKADVIICEMLDTALIDEEQVPVINNAHKYMKETTIIIPKMVYTTIELVSTNIKHITYYENNYPDYTSLSDEIKYHTVCFLKHVDNHVNEEILITVKKEGLVNAIKLTTFTYLMDNLLLEPTPMLNPPLLIPVDNINVQRGDCIKINLSYVMGSGLNTIKTNIQKNS